MKKKSLLSTNVYLKNRVTWDNLLRKTDLSSSAIEGVGKSGERALAFTGMNEPPTSAEAFAAKQP